VKKCENHSCFWIVVVTVNFGVREMFIHLFLLLISCIGTVSYCFVCAGASSKRVKNWRKAFMVGCFIVSLVSILMCSLLLVNIEVRNRLNFLQDIVTFPVSFGDNEGINYPDEKLSGYSENKVFDSRSINHLFADTEPPIARNVTYTLGVYEWIIKGLHGVELKVQSLTNPIYRCQKLPFVSNSNPKFTVVFSYYGRIRSYLVSHILRLIEENKIVIERFIISWNTPPTNARELLLMLMYGSNGLTVPVELVLHETNSITNRYVFGNFICTYSILMMDDDIYAEPKLVTMMWNLAQQVPDRIVGLTCGSWRAPKTLTSDQYNKTLTTHAISYLYTPYGTGGACAERCKFALTNFAFIAKRYQFVYFLPELAALQNAASNLTADDIFANFAVAYALKKENRLPETVNLFKSSNATTLGSSVQFCYWGCSEEKLEFHHGIGHKKGLFRYSLRRNHLELRSEALNLFIQELGGIAQGSSSICHIFPYLLTN
jgi:hypothetical protein